MAERCTIASRCRTLRGLRERIDRLSDRFRPPRRLAPRDSGDVDQTAENARRSFVRRAFGPRRGVRNDGGDDVFDVSSENVRFSVVESRVDRFRFDVRRPRLIFGVNFSDAF